ncbi:MAG TPA: 2-oxoacid:acceptor oxidoreductase subunit alpha [Planctomycetota bacterium]|nr:2-oxoacid:acceptor oxidoreductase subunit alpha [Planctomycetota bacterium]HRU52031.1 2-oxoacid:acceptor oxidoreductase subunit alpha [Planctomycetota bacterium]
MFYINKHHTFTPVHFMNGDYACAEGAIRAGCTFFAGYPITPATEIAERMSRRLPAISGIFIQMEDEIASMNAILGASWGGAKAMTATSGPGFTLMMENFGLGMITETPCVVVNVQRGGPSTGLPTMVGQADMMQAKWGSHGDYEVIALAPSSPQECYDLTIKAFEYAETYRMPVLVMMDETVGHMSERVIYPEPEAIQPTPRKYTKLPPEEYLPYRTTPENLVAEMAPVGQGYNIHMTGLTHNTKGYPEITTRAQAEMMDRLVNKVRKNADKIILTEEKYLDDAEIIIVSYGISGRIAEYPIEQARKEGIKVGLFRLITVWPFPEKRIAELASNIKAYIVPEINMGQIGLEVERCAHGKTNVIPVTHPGGGLHSPQQILEVIRRAAK